MKFKRTILVIVVALVGFYVITQPDQAAQAVQDLLSWLRDGAEAVITFIKEVFA